MEGENDGAGSALDGNTRIDTKKDSYRTLVNGNILFDSCDAARLIKTSS
jgi:hypothetical protein